MAEQYINFFIPDGGSWKALDLTRAITDYPGLSDRLDEFIKKEDLFQNYNKANENVDYLKNLKIKVGLFPDAVLGQMVCAGNCTAVDPKQTKAKSIARFVRRFRKDAFRTVGWNDFDEIFDTSSNPIILSDDGSNGSNNNISFEYQGHTYSTVQLTYEPINKGQDARLTSIEFPGGSNPIINEGNVTDYLNDDLIFISDLGQTQWDYFSDPVDVVLEWTVDESSRSIINEVVYKKTKLQLADMEGYKFYITKRPGTHKDTVNSVLWLGYDCFSSFFFHLDDKSSDSEMYLNTFDGMTYTDGDWLVPTTEGWQLITAVTIIKSINDQSSGGSIYTYNGSMAENEDKDKDSGYTYHKGSWYYNNKYDVYASNTPTSLKGALVLCTQTINSGEFGSDEYDPGADDSNRIIYNFSKYFITPNKLLTESFLLPILTNSQGKPVLSSSSATEILVKYSEWVEKLEDYIESTRGGLIPLKGKDDNGQDALIYTNKETWGRHVVYYTDVPENQDQTLFEKYETGTQPESPAKSNLNFYIEIPWKTNEGS